MQAYVPLISKDFTVEVPVCENNAMCYFINITFYGHLLSAHYKIIHRLLTTLFSLDRVLVWYLLLSMMPPSHSIIKCNTKIHK